ncbi:hypothetical protein JOB18_012959 [Solea senegalensis]|uniref:Uncharacterized protein n=1 Tax=Solea senegalensis TaxID=28829 RepID=A0AAV6RUY7_SOLSE|nr:hypothetical protein JOB18_012959 [Solea senegalensis]
MIGRSSSALFKVVSTETDGEQLLSCEEPIRTRHQWALDNDRTKPDYCRDVMAHLDLKQRLEDYCTAFTACISPGKEYEYEDGGYNLPGRKDEWTAAARPYEGQMSFICLSCNMLFSHCSHPSSYCTSIDFSVQPGSSSAAQRRLNQLRGCDSALCLPAEDSERRAVSINGQPTCRDAEQTDLNLEQQTSSETDRLDSVSGAALRNICNAVLPLIPVLHETFHLQLRVVVVVHIHVRISEDQRRPLSDSSCSFRTLQRRTRLVSEQRSSTQGQPLCRLPVHVLFTPHSEQAAVRDDGRHGT